MPKYTLIPSQELTIIFVVKNISDKKWPIGLKLNTANDGYDLNTYDPTRFETEP